jgi:hypothetical protein
MLMNGRTATDSRSGTPSSSIRIRRDPKLLPQRIAAGRVELQRLRPITLAHLKAHQRAIDRLAQAILGEQPPAERNRGFRRLARAA